MDPCEVAFQVQIKQTCTNIPIKTQKKTRYQQIHKSKMQGSTFMLFFIKLYKAANFICYLFIFRKQTNKQTQKKL